MINHGIVKFVILSISPALQKNHYKKYINIVKQLQIHGFLKLGLPSKKGNYYNYAKMYNFSPYFVPFLFYKNMIDRKLNL